MTAFTKYGMVPHVAGRLHHCKKGGSKLKWRQEDFILQESGIFTVAEVTVEPPNIVVTVSTVRGIETCSELGLPHP